MRSAKFGLWISIFDQDVAHKMLLEMSGGTVNP